MWRTVKYDNIYPRGYETPLELKAGLKSYFAFYDERRPHTALDYRMPAEVYFAKG